jgi:hypothetical protein
MISERIVKDKFIVDTVKRNLEEVKDIQLQILGSTDDRVTKNFDIPSIARNTLNRTTIVSGGNGQIMFSQKIIKQLRFLDMKNLGNLKIYNRLNWGYIYGEVANELKYGFSDAIKAGIREDLENAGFE